jgi:hypothetical protein
MFFPNDIPKIRGYIGYFGLSGWWIKTFTEDEKKYIVERYKRYHPRLGADSLLQGDALAAEYYTASSYLNFVTSIFKKPNDNTIARKIAKKALELAKEPYELHQALKWTIIHNYKVRDKEPGALDLVISACKQQIQNTPRYMIEFRKRYPSLSFRDHEGYIYLVKILEKQKKYLEAIRLIEEAKQQGWIGDWEKIIERCQIRVKKTQMRMNFE